MHRNLFEMPDTTHLPISVHFASDEEGEIVGRLAEHAGFVWDDYEIDWSHVHPFWLLCEWEGEPAGTVQVCPGRPVGRTEIMGIDPTLSHRERSIVARQLIIGAAVALKAQGSQLVCCLVPDTMPEYRRVLENYGAVAHEDGSIMLAEVP